MSRATRTAWFPLAFCLALHAQEPTSPPERVLTEATVVDPGPPIAVPDVPIERALAQEGAVPVVTFPPPERADAPRRFDKQGAPDLAELPPEFLGDPYFLGFAHDIHRPRPSERIDPDLVHRIVKGPAPGESGDVTYGFVMFRGLITRERMARVEALGVELLRYHPNNCWAARIPVARALDVADLPEVRWVGRARPSQKVNVVLHHGIATGRFAGEIPIFVNLFESDLNDTSTKVWGEAPSEVGPDGEREGNPEAAPWVWRTNGRAQVALEERGLRVKRYWEQIDAYEGWADARTVYALAELDFVQVVEWSPPLEAGHDRHVPQMGHDYDRSVTRVETQTVGVIDSGFDLFGGAPGGGHVDLNKWGVGWNHWGNGQPHSNVWSDELGEGYHGSHVAGTIMGSGSGDIALRGFSPYVGTHGGDHRAFFVKCYCYDAFQRMRNDYNDGTNVSPRPFVISNSWRAGGCLDTSPSSRYNVPANWIGSEAGARLTDDEVFDQNQLYVFCSGNEGDCNAGCGTARTLGIPSVAKNAFTVGAVQDNVTTAEGDPGAVKCWSSRGPCGDGRWKPNVVGVGCSTNSVRARTGNQYWTKCGCSMATPATTGVLAGVAEKYAAFRNSSPLARAWAMATAVTWQDQGVASSGWLPSSHLNAYGMGRIQSTKAHNGGGSYGWFRNWASGTNSGELDTFDITVYSGCTRLVLVMTWNDPQSSAGASAADVEDIDVFLDEAPFTAGATGEYSSRSAVQTVEQIIVANPTPGSYRVKIDPWRNNTPGLRWGCMVVQNFSDTTPSGSLSATVNDQYIRPGESITVDVTATTNSYVATNVYLDRQSTTAFSLQGTRSTLKDGIVLVDRDSGGDTTLGDIPYVSSSERSRTMTYDFDEFFGTDAVRTLNFQARSDNWGVRQIALNVTVDGTAPPLVSNLRSTSHTRNGWSNSRTISFAWSQSPDNLSGMDGYGEFWSSNNPTGVGAVRDFGVGTARTVTVASDYDTLYYGLRGVDRSGNWTTEVTTGPYGIDTVLPGLATNLTSTTHPLNRWTNSANVTYRWTAATDDRSGVDGYGLFTSSSPTGAPSNVRDIGAVTTHSESLASSANPYYFKMKTVDRAGNWTTGFASYGPFFVDTVAPTGPSNLASPTHTVNRWSSQTNVTVTWTAATDLHSGLGGYQSLWDHSATTDPSTRNLVAGATSWNGSLGASSRGWWFHLRAVDLAGNVGPTQHFGPILIDDVGPSGPSGLSSSHALGSWSNDPSVVMRWSAATDGESGLRGYRRVWDHSAGTVPAGALNTASGATSSTDNLTSSSSGWWFHLRAQDNAGNWGATQHYGPIFLDTVAPGVILSIDGGAGETSSRNVQLGILSSDPLSGLAQMRFRNDGGTFSPWESFAATKTWNLGNHGGSSATGTRTVEAQVRDTAGNVGAANDDIYYYEAVSYFGNGCNGSLGVPTYAITGIPGLGRPIAHVPGNTAAPVGALYAGVSNTVYQGLPLPLDLAIIGVPGCFLNVSIDVTFYAGAPVPLNVVIPIDVNLVGVPIFTQWHFYADPSGKLVVTTRGARTVLSGL